MTHHIVSFSGGKDSTAMLMMMIEKKMPIDDIVFCDTGMEFPTLYRHVAKVEAYVNRGITIIKSSKSYAYFLGEHIKTKGKHKGKRGYGHPDFQNRWCTARLKQDVFARYRLRYGDVVEYHGVAADEAHRTKKNKGQKKQRIEYPLVKWGITGKQALAYCQGKGFDWEGHYNLFSRTGCWCCPLTRMSELRTIYKLYPILWARLRTLDKLSFRKFRKDYTVSELEKKFETEKCKWFFLGFNRTGGSNAPATHL